MVVVESCGDVSVILILFLFSSSLDAGDAGGFELTSNWRSLGGLSVFDGCLQLYLTGQYFQSQYHGHGWDLQFGDVCCCELWAGSDFV